MDGSILASAIAQLGGGYRQRRDQRVRERQQQDALDRQNAMLEAQLNRQDAQEAYQGSLLEQSAERLRQQAAEGAARRKAESDARARRVAALSAKGMDAAAAEALADDEVGFREAMRPQKASPKLEEREYRGGVAQFKDGAWEKWVIEPQRPSSGGESGAGWSIQSDAQGNAYRVNSRTGAVEPLKMPGGRAFQKAGQAGTERNKREQAILNVENALTQFEANLSSTPDGDRFDPFGTSRAALGTDYENVQLQLKELYNLGVLNGPDLMLMRRIIADPNSLTGLVGAGLSPETQRAKVAAQIAKMREKITGFKTNLSQWNQTGQDDAPPSPPTRTGIKARY